MATLSTKWLTLADKMKREDPDNKIAAIIEVLAETNEIMEDSVVQEGNLATGHRTTIRTGLPSVTWRKLNYGVAQSKSETQQVDDSCGMLEGYSEVDKDLADLNGNTAAFRFSEDEAFLESMNQTIADTFIYGDTDVNPERFMGLAPRYNSISTDKTLAGSQIVDAGGTGSDNTSIWFVTWGDNACFFMYPKGSTAGIQMNDKGQQTLEDSSGNKYEGYRTHYQIKKGLTVRDWRSVSRIANIDVSNLKAGSVDLIPFMIDAWYKVRKRKGNHVIYCNETVMTALHKEASNKSNVQLTLDSDGSGAEGKPVVRFLGVPLREVEAILETEAQVT